MCFLLLFLKHSCPVAGLPLCSGGQEAAQAVLAAGEAPGRFRFRLRRPVAETGREAGEEGSRPDGGLEKSAGQFPAASLHPGGSRRGRRFCACALFTFFFSLNPVILPEALGFLFSSSVERPPRDASRAAVLGAVGEANDCSLLLSTQPPEPARVSS